MKVTGTTPPTSVTFKTTDKKVMRGRFKWWDAKQDDLAGEVLATAAYLKESQTQRYRTAAIYAKLYGNMNLFSFVGSNLNNISTPTGLSNDRPTFNLIQSCVDTLVARLSQSRPAPVFLTDNGDYKERNLAKKMNNFILGEFYQTKTYEKAPIMLRDSLVEGTGCLKVLETDDERVGVERVLLTELLIDPNESMYMEPRQLYQMKLVDRDVLEAYFPNKKNKIKDAAEAYPDQSADSTKTVSDLVMVVEGWHLRSSKNSKDGRHVIVCSSGVLMDEVFEKDKFPFVFLHYSPRLLGFWSQGLAEQLMGTQIEINSLLYTISKAIKLVGVPRIFQERSSKVVRTSHNNDIGVIIEYTGTKPTYEVAQCNAPELYTQLQKVIDYGYQQCGVSAMQAASMKPAGLNSGEAQRVYDDIASDRSAFLSRAYDNAFIDLAYLITDTAKDIAKRTGSYTTVYPNKNSAKEIELPKADMLKDPFVIQCFNMSSLPRDPAGRMAKVTEMIQGGMITIKEGRRLLDYPDLEQVEKLANASEERIYYMLDKIIEDGEYNPPDPFLDLALAKDITVQYYNLYVTAKLEEEKADMLRSYYSQVLTLIKSMTPPAPQLQPGQAPQQALANPAAPTQGLTQAPGNVLGVAA